MDPLLLSVGSGIEVYNWPVIIAMAAAPVLLIVGAVWFVRSMKKSKTQK